LRRDIHRKVQLESLDISMSNLRHAFGDKRALPDARFRKAASLRFGIRPRHRRQIDAERFCQPAMSRQLLSATQAPARDICGQCLDDAPVYRAFAIAECRDPIHTIIHTCG
jgi:hypothetical protein